MQLFSSSSNNLINPFMKLFCYILVEGILVHIQNIKALNEVMLITQFHISPQREQPLDRTPKLMNLNLQTFTIDCTFIHTSRKGFCLMVTMPSPMEIYPF